MSFCVRNLSVLAYANGFTLWHYRAAEDTLPSVERAGYFDEAREIVSDGDMMLVSASDGGRVLGVSVTGERIGVADMLRS